MLNKILNFISKRMASNSKSIKDIYIESIDKGLIVPLDMLKQSGIDESHPTYQKMKSHYEGNEKSIKNRLISKFGVEIAERIIKKEVWEGMSTDMLVESQGEWSDKSESFSNGKLKVKYFYDYSKNRLGNAAYDFEVSTEDGIVVGWKDRRTRGTNQY
jgi:hypothetical protein